MKSRRTPLKTGFFLTTAVLVSTGLFVWVSVLPAAPSRWLTGTALHGRLDRPASISWKDVPLRESLESLSKTQGVAVLIDRRVDPGGKLTIALDDVPLAEIIGEIAQSRGLGACRLGPVVYFGPPRAAARIRTLAELRRQEAGRLATPMRRKLLKLAPMKWDDFATPRKLLGQLAASGGIEISALEQIPHDLWAAANLPPLSLVDRLTLVVGQFDLTFRISPDGKSVTLVKVPDDVALVRSYPGGQQPQGAAKRWAALLPDSQIKVVGDKIFVRGLLEDHERIASPHRPQPRRVPRSGGKADSQKRFTVREARGQLGKMLANLAGWLKLELRIDHRALEQAGISLQQPVSFSVKDATMDELLRAALEPAGLTFHLQGNVLEVVPAE